MEVGKGGQFGVVLGMMLLDHAPVILTIDEAPHSLAPRSCKNPSIPFLCAAWKFDKISKRPRFIAAACKSILTDVFKWLSF